MRERSPLPVGKLSPELLADLLRRLGAGDPSVVQGPGIGLDAAVLDVGGPELLVAKTDPITFAADAIGYYAVVVNSNDLAACGARPRWMMATVLLPAGAASEETARAIMRQLRGACEKLGISLVGGHTEVTAAVTRPVVVGAMLGTVAREGLVLPSGMKQGDAILLAGTAGVEGTAVLARELGDRLRERGFGDDFLSDCAGFLQEPGISVLAAALAAAEGGATAMHDPTEGGVAMGLWEMAVAAGMALVADPAAVPVLPETKSVCEALGLDPLGLISSGSLLIAAPLAAVPSIRKAVQAAGMPCVVLGRAERGRPEVRLPDGGRWPRYDQDELTKVL